MVRRNIAGIARKTLLEPAILAILFACCLLFSSVLYASPAEGVSAEPAVTEKTQEAAVVEKAAPVALTELEKVLKKNTKCLRCHTKDKTKTLEDGTELSLTVHKEDYLGSAHGEIACVSCHEAIGNRRHPSSKTNITISTQRDYSFEINQSCRNCHDKKFAQYEGSIHASMVAQGSTKAPMCTDCHSAHAIETMENYDPVEGLPCKQCHENVFNAYTQSVHGEAKINGNVIRDTHIEAPICSDCHKAHEVTALEIGDTLRTTCIGCHENVLLLHNQWLPNTDMHLDIVSCAVCHAPFAKRRFDLHLYDNVSKSPVTQHQGDESIQKQLQDIAAEGRGGDPLEIWKSRQPDGEQGQSADISLRSRVEVVSGIAAHQIAGKSFAVRTCDSCHEEKSRRNQNVTVSVTGADGRKESFEADRETLGSVQAVDSISDFYALGGNTNKILDYLLLLSLAAGFAVPIGHYTMGKMIKEYKERGEQ